MRTLAEIEATHKGYIEAINGGPDIEQLCRWVRQLVFVVDRPEQPHLTTMTRLRAEIGPLDEKPKRTIRVAAEGMKGCDHEIPVDEVMSLDRGREGCVIHLRDNLVITTDSLSEVCAKIAESAKQPGDRPGWTFETRFSEREPAALRSRLRNAEREIEGLRGQLEAEEKESEEGLLALGTTIRERNDAWEKLGRLRTAIRDHRRQNKRPWIGIDSGLYVALEKDNP